MAIPLVGTLPSDPLDLSDSDTNFRPSTQPTLFWKGLGYALLPFLSGPGSLADKNQALFIATPGQLGIIEGANVPQEVTNYQLFSKGDAVQQLNQPSFSFSDRPSYFELLYLYLRYISASKETSKLSAARDQLVAAEATKNEAWNEACKHYSNETNTVETFIDYVNTDSDYNDKWKDEQRLQEEYRKQQTPEMEDIIRQLDITKSANDRLVYKKGNNMPCIATSEDQIRGTPQADPKDIYYRPAYGLADFDRQYRSWVAYQSNSGTEVGPYRVRMSELDDWATLGHVNIDKARPVPVEDSVKLLYKKLRINLFFQGGEPGIFDVDRGLWDVGSFRKMGSLAPDAPSYLRNRFCKTTRLLMTYGVRIEVIMPQGISESDEDELVSFLRFPLKWVGPGRYERRAGNDTYPMLLAVLASLV